MPDTVRELEVVSEGVSVPEEVDDGVYVCEAVTDVEAP